MGKWLALGINLCRTGVLYYTTKNRDTMGLPQKWGDFINCPGNLITLMVELSKLKLHWKIILSFPRIR